MKIIEREFSNYKYLNMQQAIFPIRYFDRWRVENLTWIKTDREFLHYLIDWFGSAIRIME